MSSNLLAQSRLLWSFLLYQLCIIYFLFIFFCEFSNAITTAASVYVISFLSFAVIAMNSLYVSMEYPNLIGWIALGGDPCLDGWQGVSCVLSNITSLYVRFLTFFSSFNFNWWTTKLSNQSFFLQKTKWLEFRWNLEQRFRFIYINRRNVSAPVMSMWVSNWWG